jgi:hypothetical protein
MTGSRKPTPTASADIPVSSLVKRTQSTRRRPVAAVTEQRNPILAPVVSTTRKRRLTKESCQGQPSLRLDSNSTQFSGLRKPAWSVTGPISQHGHAPDAQSESVDTLATLNS